MGKPAMDLDSAQMDSSRSRIKDALKECEMESRAPWALLQLYLLERLW